MNTVAKAAPISDKKGKVTPFKLIDSISFSETKMNPQRWLVSNVIGEHKVILLAADTNVGKSIFAQQLAISIASGMDDIVGFKIPQPSRVLLINLEMNSHQMWERNTKLLSQLTTDEKDTLRDNLLINDVSSGRNIFENNWGRIEATIRDNKRFDLIIVDNLYASQTGDDEVNRDAKELLKDIIRISEIHKSSIMLIAHHKKHDSSQDYLEIDTIRGASTYANASDVVIQMAESKSVNGFRLFRITKNRDYGKNRQKTFGLKFNEDTLWFSSTGEVDPRSHFSAYSNKTENEELLDRLGDRFTTAEILAVYAEDSKGERACYAKRKTLIKNGLVTKVGHGMYEKVK